MSSKWDHDRGWPRVRGGRNQFIGGRKLQEARAGAAGLCYVVENNISLGIASSYRELNVYRLKRDREALLLKSTKSNHLLW